MAAFCCRVLVPLALAAVGVLGPAARAEDRAAVVHGGGSRVSAVAALQGDERTRRSLVADGADAAGGGGAAAHVFSVLQYNVWNFDSSAENGGLPWKPDRVNKIAEIVRSLDPPPAAIAWNEIRRHTRPVASDAGSPQKIVTADMLADLAELLPEFAAHSRYVVGEDYGSTEEGVGLFSRFPIAAFETQRLALGGRADTNHRVLLRAELEVPGHGRLNVFVTHFSFAREQQLSNVREVQDFVSSRPLPQVLMGDLNVYADYEEPMHVLQGELEGVSQAARAARFRDAWAESHPDALAAAGSAASAGMTKDEVARARGYSFSSWDPHNRADRILVRGGDIQAMDMAVLGRATSKRTAASDHMALFAKFTLVPDAPGPPPPAAADGDAKKLALVVASGKHSPAIRGSRGDARTGSGEEKESSSEQDAASRGDGGSRPRPRWGRFLVGGLVAAAAVGVLYFLFVHVPAHPGAGAGQQAAALLRRVLTHGRALTSPRTRRR